MLFSCQRGLTPLDHHELRITVAAGQKDILRSGCSSLGHPHDHLGLELFGLFANTLDGIRVRGLQHHHRLMLWQMVLLVQEADTAMELMGVYEMVLLTAR